MSAVTDDAFAVEAETDPDVRLTNLELDVLRLARRLGNKLRLVIGNGPLAANDWLEARAHVQAIEHMVMAQIAARAYPEQLRLLGQPYPPMPEPRP